MSNVVTHIHSLTFNGIDVVDVDVQSSISHGIPSFVIVGLADKTIAESRERVRAALASFGLSLPNKKILINLAPADLLKEGSHFDLPIACALLASVGILPADEILEYIILGELSLDGSILPVSGILPASIGAVARGKGLICPKDNGSEAAWSSNDQILASSNILELVNHFKGLQVLQAPKTIIDTDLPQYPDLSDIKGQERVKRVLEIAAAGSHSLLMYGPPGTGKSMIAQRLSGILPKMTSEEILECSNIISIAGQIRNGSLVRTRPFRAPHHSCSVAAMVGGGFSKKIKPGEISLAHNGVLFLDELPEFSSTVIEALRQPLETSEVLISRSSNQVKFPANFQLIAAMNPCKCGYLNDLYRACSKAPKCASDYQMKISGPIMDRFDLHIEVSISSDFMYKDLAVSKGAESAHIALRVEKARMLQAERYQGYGIRTNNKLDGNLLIEHAIPVDDGINILNEAASKFRLSMRAYNRVLRVARTIADLDDSTAVRKIHIAEALGYRNIEYTQNTARIGF